MCEDASRLTHALAVLRASSARKPIEHELDALELVRPQVKLQLPLDLDRVRVRVAAVENQLLLRPVGDCRRFVHATARRRQMMASKRTHRAGRAATSVGISRSRMAWQSRFGGGDSTRQHWVEWAAGGHSCFN